MKHLKLKLYHYDYSNELRQFNRLDKDGSYVNYLKELTLIIEYLDNNLIQYEVDEKLNILLRKSINETDIVSPSKRSTS